MSPPRTTGEVIRELVTVIPQTYSLNEAVAWYKRWGRGKNWAEAAAALLDDLSNSDKAERTRDTLAAYGIRVEGL